MSELSVQRFPCIQFYFVAFEIWIHCQTVILIFSLREGNIKVYCLMFKYITSETLLRFNEGLGCNHLENVFSIILQFPMWECSNFDRKIALPALNISTPALYCKISIFTNHRLRTQGVYFQYYAKNISRRNSISEKLGVTPQAARFT